MRFKPFRCTLFTLLLMGAGPTFAEPAETIYVSLTPKNTVTRFLNRFATPQHQVVVTTSPVQNAIKTLKVEVPADRKIYIAEIPPEAGWKVTEHLGRLDRFYVLALNPELQPHIHDPLHAGIYIEAVAEQEMAAPSVLSPKLEGQPRAHADVPAVSPAFLDQKLRELTGALPVTINGSSTTIAERGTAAGRQKAAAYLAAYYRELGFTVSYHHYGNDGINVVAERAGSAPSRVLLVTSHYDSVSNPGADDNGSGTVSAMAVAQALAKVPLQHTLRIVAFDQEERGLVGSKAYVQWLNSRSELNNVLGVLNLEMTAYDSDGDGAFHAIDCGENTSSNLTRKLGESITQTGLVLQRREACTNRSDHAMFWRYNVPAIAVSQNFFAGDANPCYHRACDQVGSLNGDYMTKLTRAVTSTVADIVKTPSE